MPAWQNLHPRTHPRWISMGSRSCTVCMKGTMGRLGWGTRSRSGMTLLRILSWPGSSGSMAESAGAPKSKAGLNRQGTMTPGMAARRRSSSILAPSMAAAGSEMSRRNAAQVSSLEGRAGRPSRATGWQARHSSTTRLMATSCSSPSPMEKASKKGETGSGS